MLYGTVWYYHGRASVLHDVLVQCYVQLHSTYIVIRFVQLLFSLELLVMLNGNYATDSYVNGTEVGVKNAGEIFYLDTTPTLVGRVASGCT